MKVGMLHTTLVLSIEQRIKIVQKTINFSDESWEYTEKSKVSNPPTQSRISLAHERSVDTEGNLHQRDQIFETHWY